MSYDIELDIVVMADDVVYKFVSVW